MIISPFFILQSDGKKSLIYVWKSSTLNFAFSASDPINNIIVLQKIIDIIV